jgi:hypothetical protein
MAMAAALLALTQLAPSQLPLYKTPGAPVNARVDDLVKRMNMAEKVRWPALNRPCLPTPSKSPPCNRAPVCPERTRIQPPLCCQVNQLVLPFGAKFPADYASFNTSGLGGACSARSHRRSALLPTRLIPDSLI